EAECVLLYSGADLLTWRAVIEKPNEKEEPPDPEVVAASFKHLDAMDRYCRGAVCRHRALLPCFGQPYAKPTLQACDLCLRDIEVVAQKSLSCVARVKQSCGINHVTAVLRGEASEAVLKRKHDQLSTFGLLKGSSKADLRDWIYQLISQDVLLQVGDEYPVLKLCDGSWEVMRGEREVRLVQLVRRKKGERPQKSEAAEVSWEDVDRGLFEALRKVRRELAAAEKCPPFQVFSDRVLRDLARLRPSSPKQMLRVTGVGEVKLRNYGEAFLTAIRDYCQQNNLAQDCFELGEDDAPLRASSRSRVNATAEAAFKLFRDGAVVE